MVGMTRRLRAETPPWANVGTKNGDDGFRLAALYILRCTSVPDPEFSACSSFEPYARLSHLADM